MNICAMKNISIRVLVCLFFKMLSALTSLHIKCPICAWMYYGSKYISTE